MKKLLLSFTLAIGLFAVIHAATPLDQPYLGQAGPYSNTTLFISTLGVSGASILNTFPSITKTQGGTTYSGRNCVTNMILQLSFGSTFYALDGGTTIYTIAGNALGSTTTSTAAGYTTTLQITRDHLGPICGAAGNTMTFSVPAPSIATPNNAINIEGYTYFPPFVNTGQ